MEVASATDRVGTGEAGEGGRGQKKRVFEVP